VVVPSGASFLQEEDTSNFAVLRREPLSDWLVGPAEQVSQGCEVTEPAGNNLAR
jgi:hypothetical protein